MSDSIGFEKDFLSCTSGIQKDIESLEKKITNLKEKLVDFEHVHEEKIKHYTELEKKVSQMTLSNKRVILNVGGQRFETTLTTLTKQPSIFSAMFSGNFSVTPDERGEFFIDRDPKFFSLILNYMRRGTVNIKDLREGELDELREELQYYCLDGMMQELDSELESVEQSDLKPLKTSLKSGATVELKSNSPQGFFNWLGTKEGRENVYSNPLSSLKLVDVQSLGSYSFPDSSLGASLIFDPAYKNQQNASFATSTVRTALVIKLLNHKVKPTGYFIVSSYTSHKPRNWSLQGSKDGGQTWTLLSNHVNEELTKVTNGHTFPVTSTDFFTWLKIEPATNCCENSQFVLNFIEFFGFVQKQ